MTTTTTDDLTLGSATLTTGLLAGLYYAYACSVMPGLARADDHTFVSAMNHINDAIQNPVFFVTFVGAPAATALLAWRERRAPRSDRRWITIALGLNVLALVTTMAVNVPLNDPLPNDGDRDAFESAWVVWTAARGVAATGGFACLLQHPPPRARG